MLYFALNQEVGHVKVVCRLSRFCWARTNCLLTVKKLTRTIVEKCMLVVLNKSTLSWTRRENCFFNKTLKCSGCLDKNYWAAAAFAEYGKAGQFDVIFEINFWNSFKYATGLTDFWLCSYCWFETLKIVSPISYRKAALIDFSFSGWSVLCQCYTCMKFS